MCGILFTNKQITDLQKVIKFLKKRGPDHTEHKIINGYNFVHVLLSMTGGGLTIQPFIYDNIVILFNGEIYNYKDFGDFNSDGECIIESYRKYGHNFVRNLDGEFSIVLVDFNTNELIYSTDVFSTKPLWSAIDNNNNIGIASYESCLKELDFTNIVQVPANSTFRVQLNSLGESDFIKNKIEKRSVYDFDLNQHKTTYDDWNKAFEKAILKRTRNIKHGVYLGLSAGYDSGLIACALSKLNIDYKPYSILGSENPDIIKSRHDWKKSNRSKGEIIDISRDEFLKENKFLKENCEEYILKIENQERQQFIKYHMEINKLNGSNPQRLNDLKIAAANMLKVYKFRMKEQKVTDDNGSIGLSHICNKAEKQGYKIYLSGSGADEIISDYGFNGIKHYNHSTIGGFFPKDLKTVFPWKNFFGNTQRAYLMKEEVVSGSHGVEGRYPFLDKDVVQEFLWLSHDLKNKNYKSVIYNYLKKENYPFEENKKVGFGCGFTGPHHITEESFKKINNTNKQYTPVGTNKSMKVDLEFDKQCEKYIKQNNINFEILFNKI
jgi:asparagine synthetase B (glutamine-hydrolysing)